jgi:hypothetical protein
MACANHESTEEEEEEAEEAEEEEVPGDAFHDGVFYFYFVHRRLGPQRTLTCGGGARERFYLLDGGGHVLLDRLRARLLGGLELLLLLKAVHAGCQEALPRRRPDVNNKGTYLEVHALPGGLGGGEVRRQLGLGVLVLVLAQNGALLGHCNTKQ